MKRKQLVKHLTDHGAFFLREGRRHSIFQRGPFKTMDQRHTEIVDALARKICKDLEIPWVK
jgi:mRNA interferase HicA